MKKIFNAIREHIWIYILGLLLAALCLGARDIIMAVIFRVLFDASVDADMTQLLDGLRIGITWLVVLSMLQPIFWYIFQRVTIKIGTSFRFRLYNKVKGLTIKYFQDEHSGNLISRLTNDVNVFEQGFNFHIPNLVLFFFSGIGSVIFMFWLDVRLALVSMLTGSVGLIISALYAKPLRRVGRLVQDRLGFMTESFSDIYAGIQVIKSFNLYSRLIKKFTNRNEDVYQATITRVKRNSELATFNSLARWLDILGYIVVGAYFAMKGWVSVGTIIAITQLKVPVMRLFLQIGNIIANIQASLAAGDRIFEVLEQDDEPETYSQLAISENQPEDKTVIVRNLDFGYNAEEILFESLNLEVAKDKKIALVGPSGGGKSTIFKLLLGFYPPKRGEIVINSHSMGCSRLKELRENIAYVPQNAYLFTGTIADNIRYGNLEAAEEQVIEAAKIANAHDFIMEFDKGYDTMVGEKGAQLSGGQRQRIAIARAVLRDAPILLLDEATSSLDTESEHLVQEALDRLAAGRTTLVIAHRFATIEDADEILVIAEGKVKERGTHEYLMNQKDGVYRNLVELTKKAS